ncbi:hypothetical protein MBLNU457_7216t1 [Dothideomycetes sp. NU457]
MEQAQPELDEIQFRRPDVLQWWQGVHANSVHGYFKESPFCDPMSKNYTQFAQAFDNPQLFAQCANRQELERILRERPGLEHMIVGEPQPTTDPSEGPDTGVWVIRKQDRKRQPRGDELTTVGTHFIVNENIYQAPAVYDVVGNHLISAMNSLNKFIDKAASLPMYTPASGYTYFPPATAKTSTTQSTSREGSVAVDSEQRPQSLTADGASSIPDAGNSADRSAAIDPRDSMLLEQSFRLMQAHGDEFMDENPLRGEPGSFVFTHTKDRLKARQAEAEAAAARLRDREAERAKSAVPAAFSTRLKEESKTPENKPQLVQKGSKGDGKRRRKSRTANISPTTSSPATGGTPSAL